MSRSTSMFRRLAPALLLAVGLTACASDAPIDESEPAATAEQADDTDGDADQSDGDDAAPADDTDIDAAPADDAAAFPVTVTDDAGDVTIEARPEAIVSLSPTSTEMLFALGAGDAVVAVDDFSSFPPEAPSTELSGFTPNLEAILEFSPDLVVLAGDSNDVVAGLTEVGVTVLQYGAANDFETAFAQLRALGTATGTDAEATIDEIETELAEIAASVDVEPGLTYYHELSSDLFSATASTFIGEIYGLFGLVNIADAADADGFGYPQLSAEYIVEQDPDYVFLACTVFCGETVETFSARDAFTGLTAVAEGDVVELDDDTASRWGPRMVEFAEAVAAALQAG